MMHKLFINKINYTSAAIKLMVFCCWTFLAMQSLQAQTPPASEDKLDSLKNLLNQKGGTEKVDLLLDISQAQWNQSFEESLEYASRGYTLAKEMEYPEGMADALNRIGNVHYLLGNNDNVFENYYEAVNIAIQLEDHRRMGMYLNNIGLLYREQKQFDSAEVYMLKALSAKEQGGDPVVIASTLNNLGVLYRDIQRYDLSVEYFSKQIRILEETGDLRNLSRAHRQSGEVFLLQELYDESLDHSLEALRYAEEISDSMAIVQSLNQVARSYLALDEMKEAREIIEKSSEITDALSSLQLRRNNYNLQYLYYKQAGDNQTALDYFISYGNLKDSVREQTSANRYNQLQRIFETEKQKNNIELLQKETQIQELQITRHDNLKLLLLILVILIFIFTFFVAYRFIITKKTNTLLKQKIDDLEKTNDKLRLSAVTLEQLNATKNRFFSIIAHDLKNPFNALLGFSELITTSFNQLKEQEIKEYISLVHQSSQNLYKLLENLLKWSAAQTGKMHYLPEQFDLVSLINSEIHFLRINASKKQIEISKNTPDEMIINSDKLVLSSVIRNILDNAIKFTRPGGNIKVSAEKKYREVIVKISDSGIGIPKDMQKKMFSIDGEIGRKGTNNEEGGGLGLILCKDLIERAGGKIGMESGLGKGSTFWFSLPVEKLN
ncbi:MAG: tetratricopeptide repeat protein [Bacteroidales bacterium]